MTPLVVCILGFGALVWSSGLFTLLGEILGCLRQIRDQLVAIRAEASGPDGSAEYYRWARAQRERSI
jgi:hypothetical protein